MVNIGLLEVLIDIHTLLCVSIYVSVNFAIFHVCDNKVLRQNTLDANFSRCSDLELAYSHILCDGHAERDEFIHFVINMTIFCDFFMAILFYKVKVQLLLFMNW